MTQNTQTTEKRIAALIDWEGIVEAPKTIAAEIDGLTAELAQRTLERDAAQEALGMVGRMAKSSLDSKDTRLAEARAEAERLRPAAEAWEAAEVANVANANRMSLIMDAHAYAGAKAIWVAAQEQADTAAARARAAKVTP